MFGRMWRHIVRHVDEPHDARRRACSRCVSTRATSARTTRASTTPEPNPIASDTVHSDPPSAATRTSARISVGQGDQHVDQVRDRLADAAAGRCALQHAEREPDHRGDRRGQRARRAASCARRRAPGVNRSLPRAVGAEPVRGGDRQPLVARDDLLRVVRLPHERDEHHREHHADDRDADPAGRLRHALTRDLMARSCPQRRAHATRAAGIEQAVHEVDEEPDDEHDHGDDQHRALHLHQVAGADVRAPASDRRPGA